MSIDAEQRALLARLADVLIPAGGGMPSASQADVAGQWLDEVLKARPDLAIGLCHALNQVANQDPVEAVEKMRSRDPATFGILAEIVPGAYFMNPAVRQAIGYAGQVAQSIDPRPDYMEDGLLESVIRRGPIYRPTPA